MIARRTLFALLGLAALGAAARPALAAGEFEGTARKFVDVIGAQAIKVFGTVDKDTRYANFRELLNRSFDVPAIARFVLGAYWTKLKPDQQGLFLKVFEDYVVANYAAKPWQVEGVFIETVATHPVNDNDIAVDTLIHVPHKQNKPIALGWRIYNAGPAPKIIDLKVDGLSLVVSQRSEFTSVLRQKQDDFGAFLEFVRDRTKKLEATPQVAPQKASAN